MYVIMIFFLIILSWSQLPILMHGGTNYSSILTAIGYVPYGYNISGEFTFLKNLCQPQTQFKIILTYLTTTECTYEEELQNGEASELIIFSFKNEQLQKLPHGHKNSTIIIIAPQTARNLSNSKDKSITVYFEREQNSLPELIYIIHLINQTTDVLKQFQQFRENQMNFEFLVVYYTEEVTWIDNITTFEDTYFQVIYVNDKLTFREILYENLGQICIFQEYGLDAWLNYRIRYIDECYDYFDNALEIQSCQVVLRQQQFPNQSKIELCINNSFVKNSLNNTILQHQSQLSLSIELQVSAIGWIAINNQMLWGDYMIRREILGQQQTLIFSALCASYSENKPDVCVANITVQNYSYTIIIFIIISLVIIVVTGICICRRIKTKFINEQREGTQARILPKEQMNDELEMAAQ